MGIKYRDSVGKQGQMVIGHAKRYINGNNNYYLRWLNSVLHSECTLPKNGMQLIEFMLTFVGSPQENEDGESSGNFVKSIKVNQRLFCAWRVNSENISSNLL